MTQPQGPYKGYPPTNTLQVIQIRYRIGYMTWLRMKAYKQSRPITMSVACNTLLNNALDDIGITRDPAVLLGQKEKPVG